MDETRMNVLTDGQCPGSGCVGVDLQCRGKIIKCECM